MIYKTKMYEIVRGCKGGYNMNTTLLLASKTIPKDWIPFLIPLIALQIGLYIFTMVHIFRHDHYKRGSRLLWVIVATIGCEFVGPIIYMVFGREDD